MAWGGPFLSVALLYENLKMGKVSGGFTLCPWWRSSCCMHSCQQHWMFYVPWSLSTQHPPRNSSSPVRMSWASPLLLPSEPQPPSDLPNLIIKSVVYKKVMVFFYCLPLSWEKYKNLCLLSCLHFSFEGLVTSPPAALGALTFLR